MLSQLDDRYFRGLEGQYAFSLAFRVHKAGQDDYLVRTRGSYRMKRSVSVELDLEAGEYLVLVKIDAERYDEYLPPEVVVRKNAKTRREKLLRMGLAYDLAHSKAKFVETPEEKAAREAYEKRKKEKYRERLRKAIMKERHKQHYQQTKQLGDRRKMIQRAKEKQKAKAEKKEAEVKRREEERETEAKKQAEKRAEEAKRQAEKETGEVEGKKKELEVDNKENVTKQEGIEKKDGVKQEGGEQKEAEESGQKDGEEGRPDKPDPEKTEAGKEESAMGTPGPTKTATAQDTSPQSEGTGDGKTESGDQETSDLGDAKTPISSSNSGILPDASTEQQPSGSPAESAAQKPALGLQGGPKLESQGSFYTSFETLTENIDKPNPGGSPEPAADKQNEGEVSANAKPEVADAGVKKVNEGRRMQLPQLVEDEIRELIGAFDYFGRTKDRLVALMTGQEPGRHRRHAQEESGSDYDSNVSRGQSREPSRQHSRHHSRQPSPMTRNHLQPVHRQHHSHHNHHRHHSRPPPGPPPPGPPLRGPMVGIPGAPGIGGPPPPPPPGRFAYQGGYVSDAESDRSDGLVSIPSVSEISDRELDYRVEESLRQIEIPHHRPPPPVVHREVEDEFEKDPWNAVAVVGLRVYYKIADVDKDKEIVTLRVVRPSRYELDADGEKKKAREDKKGEEDGDKDETDEAKVLDLDDSAKDATII